MKQAVDVDCFMDIKIKDGKTGRKVERQKDRLLHLLFGRNYLTSLE
jgi:hypothetical protein